MNTVALSSSTPTVRTILRYTYGLVPGLLVLRFTRLGAYVVAAWLIAIAVVLMLGGWYDIAVRDLVMAIGAWCLARLYEGENMSS